MRERESGRKREGREGEREGREGREREKKQGVYMYSVTENRRGEGEKAREAGEANSEVKGGG